MGQKDWIFRKKDDKELNVNNGVKIKVEQTSYVNKVTYINIGDLIM